MRLFLVSFLAVAAWGQTHYRYVCPGNVRFDVQFLPLPAQAEGNALLLMADKPPLMLPRVISASGAKYSDGYTTFWTKGSEAFLESGSVNAKGCTGQSVTSADKTMRGMFVYMADAANFTDCETQSRLPVAQELGYLELEKAYSRHKTNPGAPLFVMLEGRVENRPDAEGRKEVPHLVVTRFLSAQPGKQCDGGGTLTGKWTVTNVGEQPVNAGRPPLLELQDANRVTGFSGCNRFSGTYTRNGATLRFSGVAATMMACPEPAMTLERQMLQALGQVTEFRISSGRLTLLGAEGQEVLRLQRQP